VKEEVLRQIAAFQEKYDYSMDYAREVAELDPQLYVDFYHATQLGKYTGGLSREAHFAVRLLGTMAGDCGPCVQLGVKMASEAGVDEGAIEAVLLQDDERLAPETALCVRFARSLLRRDAELEEHREQVTARFGKQGAVAIAYALIASYMYPTLKYALGQGHGCTRISVVKRAVTAQRASLNHA
jgi:hypothetical protein